MEAAIIVAVVVVVANIPSAPNLNLSHMPRHGSNKPISAMGAQPRPCGNIGVELW